MKMQSGNVTASDPAAHAPAGGSQPGWGPSRQVAELLILAGSPSHESRLPTRRDSANPDGVSGSESTQPQTIVMESVIGIFNSLDFKKMS